MGSPFTYVWKNTITSCMDPERGDWGPGPPLENHKALVFLVLTIQSLENRKIVGEYDQEIPQSQTADNPVAPQGRAAQPSRDTRRTN